MVKSVLGVILSVLLFSAYGYADGITCGDQQCAEAVEEVFLKPSSQRKVIHLYFTENDIKIPIFADISNIGTALTRPKNSFHSVYYYGEKQSISVSLFDVDSDMDLLKDPKTILLFKNDDISVFFYETSHSKGHPQTPLFEAVMPIKRGNKDRFTMYATKGIPENELKALLSQIELNQP